MDENKTFYAVLALGGVIFIAGACAGVYFAMGGETRLEDSAPAVLSERMLRKCEAAMVLLGEPVAVELGGDYSGESADLQIAVNGAKASGTYHFVTRRSGKSWTVINADLEFAGERWDVVTCKQQP